MSIRTTQIVFEVIVSPSTGNFRLSQSIVETLYTTSPNLRFTQSVVEVLRSRWDLYETSHSITFTQTVASIGSVYNRTINHSLTLTQDVSEVVESPSTVNLIVSQTVVKVLYKTSPNLLITQSVVEVLRTITDTQVIDQSITLTQTISKQGTYNLSISQSLSFGQAFPQTHSTQQSIIFTHNVTEHKAYNRILNTPIILSHSVSDQNTYNFSINDILVFNVDFVRNIQLGNINIGIPSVTYSITPKKCRVILSVPSINIILPCPLFGDSQSNTSTFNIKRTMTGVRYTYVKQSDLQTLKYNFKLVTKKALELRNFVRNHMSSLITLSNWKSESWLVYLISNPLEQITEGLAQPTDEYINVSLEFEGICISR